MSKKDLKLITAGFLLAPIALVLLFLVFGLFAAIFNGVLWLIATHLVIAIISGVALWIVGTFIIGAAINAIGW